MAARWLLALAFGFSFLPRALDHHWAERLPWHAHFARAEEPGHLHPYETVHSHNAAGFAAKDAPDQGRGSLVSFRDEVSSSPVAPAPPLLSEEPEAVRPNLGRFSSPSREVRWPAGIAPGVPHPPPISIL